MSDCAPPPAWQVDDAEIAAPVRRVAVQREHALARGCYRWARRCLKPPAMFVSWDRSQKHSDQQHIREAQRGIVGGFPDTGVIWPGGFLAVELKRPGAKPTARQLHVGRQIIDAGQHWAWADSVSAFASHVADTGVPLVANWQASAALQDQYVAADIRKQDAHAAAKRAGAFQPKAMRGRVTPGAVARARKAGAWPV